MTRPWHLLQGNGTLGTLTREASFCNAPTYSLLQVLPVVVLTMTDAVF